MLADRDFMQVQLQAADAHSGKLALALERMRRKLASATGQDPGARGAGAALRPLAWLGPAEGSLRRGRRVHRARSQSPPAGRPPQALPSEAAFLPCLFSLTCPPTEAIDYGLDADPDEEEEDLAELAVRAGSRRLGRRLRCASGVVGRAATRRCQLALWPGGGARTRLPAPLPPPSTPATCPRVVQPCRRRRRARCATGMIMCWRRRC